MKPVVSYDRRSRTERAVVAQETAELELATAVEGASEARHALQALTRGERAVLLDSMADHLDASRDELIRIADAETALGQDRLNGELTRTVGQFRLFADVVRDGQFLDIAIDHARDSTPDLRRMNYPLGVVAVFGASNFPFAFSVPGGDTASALAAGCPVVVKAHPAHPDTSIHSAQVLRSAIVGCGMSPALLGLVHGTASGTALVAHPNIAAVGFTGSQAGGLALQRIAAERSSPIPFFGELGSLNPLVVMPHAARSRGREIAQGLAQSMTLSAGQFCTKPGVVLIPEEVADTFFDDLQQALATYRPQPLLHDGISEAFATHLESLRSAGFAVSGTGENTSPPAVAIRADLDTSDATRRKLLLSECFGPFAIVTTYRSRERILDLLGMIPPSLAISIHADEMDSQQTGSLLNGVLALTGRVVWNGFPTGVAVTWSMHHGGPFPATTNSQHTSVGAAAIRRWLRPVVLQNVPRQILPTELTDEPQGLGPRRVDGELSQGVPASHR